jgi:hypothetical protein
MMPVSSMSETNLAGGTEPSSGSFQRMSASSPATAPLFTSIFGW